MSFFAVMTHPEDNPFQIKECHLNVWALPSPLGHRFLFDLGLRIKAGNDPVNRIRVALPCSTSANALLDLLDIISDRKTLQLIFGRPVKFQGSTIDYGAGPVKFLSVSTTESEVETKWQRPSFSVWTVALGGTLAANDEGYMRVRFKISQPGRLWVWKKTLLGKTGAQVDLRVADAREAWTAGDAHTLLDKAVEIQKLFAFVISPSHLQPTLHFPEPHYIRLLEGPGWERYLKRRIGLVRSPKLVIYQWRASGVDPNSRFQGFLDLDRERGVTSQGLPFVVVILGTLLFAKLIQNLWVSLEIEAYLLDLWAQVWKWLLGILSFSIVTKVSTWWNWGQRAIEKVRRAEDWILQKLARD